MKNKNIWVAEVKWTLEAFYENNSHLKGSYDNVDFSPSCIEYFGPFTIYDTGIKVWSAEFSEKYKGKIEHINYHKLVKP